VHCRARSATEKIFGAHSGLISRIWEYYRATGRWHVSMAKSRKPPSPSDPSKPMLDGAPGAANQVEGRHRVSQPCRCRPVCPGAAASLSGTQCDRAVVGGRGKWWQRRGRDRAVRVGAIPRSPIRAAVMFSPRFCARSAHPAATLQSHRKGRALDRARGAPQPALPQPGLTQALSNSAQTAPVRLRYESSGALSAGKQMTGYHFVINVRDVAYRWGPS
jgi:hypothetical protein